PDGKWLDFCCGEYPSVQIMCIPAAGGEPIVVHNYRQDESLIKLAGWLPDSKAILFTVSTPNRGLTNYDVTGLFKVSIEDKKVEKIWKPDKKGILKLNVSPDGEYAAYIQTQSRYEGLWVLENFLPREVARAGTQ
ncbi:MAG TPA: hypothetical protein PK360_13090, partial [bacterium]|nr:hypothetical protein [bacterium]